jgi:hypothetical protein
VICFMTSKPLGVHAFRDDFLIPHVCSRFHVVDILAYDHGVFMKLRAVFGLPPGLARGSDSMVVSCPVRV